MSDTTLTNVDILLVEDNPGDVILALEAFKEASESTVAAIEGYGDVVGNVSEYLGKLQEGDKEVVTATVGGALNMLGTAIGVPNMGSVLMAGVLGAGGGVPLTNFVRDRRRKKRGEPVGGGSPKEETKA